MAICTHAQIVCTCCLIMHAALLQAVMQGEQTKLGMHFCTLAAMLHTRICLTSWSASMLLRAIMPH